MASQKGAIEGEARSFFSINEVATRLGISKSLVYALINSGALKSSHIGSRHIVTTNQLVEFETAVDAGGQVLVTLNT